jgi:cob(I)alamin adenosyltransferase
MTVRLNRITTRSGDDGSTGLADGSRLPKHAPRMEAIGSVDELNAHVGMLRAVIDIEALDALLSDIQHRLFDLGGALSLPGNQRFPETAVSDLESALASYNAELPPLTSFVLPAGSEAVARCHVARTVCRRTERCLTALAESDASDAAVLRVYLNRLSDLLFVLARWLGRKDGSEVLWTPRPAAED